MTVTSNGATRKLAQRPAESAGLASAVVVLIGAALGIDDPAIFAALVVVVGAAPSLVTYGVELFRKRGAEG